MSSSQREIARLSHGVCDAQAALPASGRRGARAGSDGEGRAEGAQVCEAAAEAKLAQGGIRVSTGHPDFESGGGALRQPCGDARAGVAFGCDRERFRCGGAQEDFEGEAREGNDAGAGGEAREHVPPAAGDGVEALATAEPRRCETGDARGAVAATRAELERHAAADDDSHAVSGVAGEARAVVIQREFAHHHPGVARLNNGSFGSAPRRVLDDQAQWNAQWRRHPDEFCWDPLSDGFFAARQGLAELIGNPDVEEVVLLENATTGAAIVALDCMWEFLEGRYHPGDAIVMFDSAYGAVKKCFQVHYI